MGAKTTAVAIDGPAGAGKSTVGRELARRLGWRYVDTGAMYRAVTLKALREGADLEDAAALARIARTASIELVEPLRPLNRDAQDGQDGHGRRPIEQSCLSCTSLSGPGEGPGVVLDGEDVTEEIRAPGLTRAVRHVARAAGARAELVKKQRALAGACPVVMEGRDIATVVLPEALAKFYLDASPRVRAGRRAQDLEGAGECVAVEALEKELTSRDRSDRERAAGALKTSEDAEVIDTTDMSFDEVVDVLEKKVRERLAGAAEG